MILLVRESRIPMNSEVEVAGHCPMLPIRIQRDFHPTPNQLRFCNASSKENVVLTPKWACLPCENMVLAARINLDPFCLDASCSSLNPGRLWDIEVLNGGWA